MYVSISKELISFKKILAMYLGFSSDTVKRQ